MLDQLRQDLSLPTTADSLRKALANRNNYLVAKAAKITAEAALRTLVPDLLSALERFFINAAKTDPQCWAKKALYQALADLAHHDSEIYLRGLTHFQLEPV